MYYDKKLKETVDLCYISWCNKSGLDAAGRGGALDGDIVPSGYRVLCRNGSLSLSAGLTVDIHCALAYGVGSEVSVRVYKHNMIWTDENIKSSSRKGFSWKGLKTHIFLLNHCVHCCKLLSKRTRSYIMPPFHPFLHPIIQYLIIFCFTKNIRFNFSIAI